MTITAVAGHFISFDFPREFKEWENTPQESLFTAPLETKIEERNQNLKHLLVAEARKHDVLFLWLDCDLEGEAICFEVMDVCLESNPRMEVFRAKFSSLSHRDITRAMRFPDKPNKNMSDSVKARSEIDLRIGAAFTRMQTLYLRKYPQLAENNAVITYGPCQFPTLGFVVEQHNKIQSFIPENFWSLTLELENADPDEPDKKMTTSFTWDRFTQLSLALLELRFFFSNTLRTLIGDISSISSYVSACTNSAWQTASQRSNTVTSVLPLAFALSP